METAYELKNLGELVRGDTFGYHLLVGYIVQRRHSMKMGHFPIISKATGKMVVFTDFETAKHIWACMSPADSFMSSIIVFCNKAQGIGFPIQGSTTKEQMDVSPVCVVDDDKYESMGDRRCEAAFIWAPGLPHQLKPFDSVRFDRIIAATKDPASS